MTPINITILSPLCPSSASVSPPPHLPPSCTCFQPQQWRQKQNRCGALVFQSLGLDRLFLGSNLFVAGYRFPQQRSIDLATIRLSPIRCSRAEPVISRIETVFLVSRRMKAANYGLSCKIAASLGRQSLQVSLSVAAWSCGARLAVKGLLSSAAFGGLPRREWSALIARNCCYLGEREEGLVAGS
ncbi:cytochrome P450 [Striga asiatica]|uniref:Cytochrome P450 n=1 Tax=Striga asiatica TaxID=4170 RepID=A0A5A7RGN6_STRAF|nr:cytochrome P450 [Striga asiatica]